MDREISESDLGTLRQLCGLPATEPLPEKLVSKYWANKIVCDRGGLNIRDQFVRIVVECGYGKLTEKEANPDVATLYRRKEIKTGHPVLVNWREKKVPGKLIAIDAVNQATVMIDGQERLVKADQVTPQAAA